MGLILQPLPRTPSPGQRNFLGRKTSGLAPSVLAATVEWSHGYDEERDGESAGLDSEPSGHLEYHLQNRNNKTRGSRTILNQQPISPLEVRDGGRRLALCM